MKKIITLQILMILLTSQLPAQTKNDYLLISKRQKTAAWILLGGGLTLDFIGTYELFDGLNEIGNGKHHHKIGTGLSLIFVSLPPIIGSIPLFTKSARNKRTGMSISFSNQPLPALVKNHMVRRSFPSIGLQFKL